MIHLNYTTIHVTTVQKGRILVHEALRYWSQCQNFGHGEDNRDDINTTQGFETKNRSDLGKRGNLIICKETENDKTPPYAVAALYVMFVLSGKP